MNQQTKDFLTRLLHVCVVIAVLVFASGCATDREPVTYNNVGEWNKVDGGRLRIVEFQWNGCTGSTTAQEVMEMSNKIKEKQNELQSPQH